MMLPPQNHTENLAWNPEISREIVARFQQATIDEATASGEQPTDEIVTDPEAWKEIASLWLNQQAH
jgi:hypothetical protein